MTLWEKFQTRNRDPREAFETLCNQLFERWCMREYRDKVQHIHVVNGAGGDGGVEAYAMLEDGTYIGVQAKWFLNPLDSDKIKQIRSSITAARRVRPELARYIVCIPRNLG